MRRSSQWCDECSVAGLRQKPDVNDLSAFWRTTATLFLKDTSMKIIDWLRTILVASITSLSFTAAAEDWPFWRGAQQNNHSTANDLLEFFKPKGGEGSQVLWFKPEASGISTPIVMNGRLFTIVRHDPGKPTEAEKVIALDAATGELLWENTYNVFLTDFPAERIGWSNVTGDPKTGKIYVLGSCSLMQCIDAQSGKTLWNRSLSEEFGMLSTYGGRTNTPVLFENLVIVSGVTTGWDQMARPSHRFFAFDKNDGRLVWISETRPLPEDTTYSTPVIREIDGRQVMVAGAGDGDVYGIAPRTGKVLWSHPISRRGINTSPAISRDGTVYIGHSEENPEGTAMGAVVAIDAVAALSGSQSAERWRAVEVMNGKSSPLLIEDDKLGSRIYAVEDSGRLRILDAETGEEIGKPVKLGTAMRGTPLYADGKIYAATLSGIVHVLRPTDEGVETIFKTRLPSGQDVNGSMVTAGGSVYLPTTKGLYCLGKQPFAGNVEPTSSKESPAESKAATVASTAAATLQIVPREAIVSPGDPVTLNVRAFDDLDHPVETPSDVTFDVEGPASVTDGVLQIKPDAGHEAVTVIVRAGDAIGSARFRVVPPLPWKFDFSAGEVPITWIGARYRHEARLVDGEPAIVKISTIPKGTRSQAWFGPTDLSSYTITADVQAASGPVPGKGTGTDKLPDIGLIGQRYVLDLMGESQQLQIRTWAAQLRMA